MSDQLETGSVKWFNDDKVLDLSQEKMETMCSFIFQQ